MKPDIDRDLKRSTYSVLLGRGRDWSCGPQLVSHNDIVVLGGRGNLTKASVSARGIGENSIPRSEEPMRYLRTYLAAVT